MKFRIEINFRILSNNFALKHCNLTKHSRFANMYFQTHSSIRDMLHMKFFTQQFKHKNNNENLQQPLQYFPTNFYIYF